MITDLILFILVSLLVTAASLYLPNHLSIIYNRLAYYIHGDFTYISSSERGRVLDDSVKVATNFVSQTVSSAIPSRAVESVGETISQMREL